MSVFENVLSVIDRLSQEVVHQKYPLMRKLFSDFPFHQLDLKGVTSLQNF